MHAPTVETTIDAYPQPRVARQFSKLHDLEDLAGRLKQVLHARQDTVVVLDGHGFILRVSEGTCYSDTPLSAIDSCTSGTRSMRIGDALPEDSGEGRKVVPLEDFLWRVALKAGSGSLLPWLSSVAAYRLSSPPKAEDSARYATLRDVMEREALPPLVLAQKTKLSLAVIYDFLNACSLEGCLEVSEAHDLEPPPPLFTLEIPDDCLEVAPPEEQHRGVLQLLRNLVGKH